MCKEFFFLEKACGCFTPPHFIYCPITIVNCWGLTGEACIAVLRQCPIYDKIRFARSRFCDVHADEILETGGDDTFYRRGSRRKRMEEREFRRGGDERSFEAMSRPKKRNADFWG